MATVTARTICTDALSEVGIIAPQDTPGNTLAQFTLGKLNRLIDNWNAQREAVYAIDFLPFTLVPNLAPHTIGPSGTFTVAQRPVSIEGINLILNTVAPNINISITLRDSQWWLRQTIPTLAIPYPTDCYYDPSWPNGTLNFWPIPQIAYGVEIEVRTVLAAVTLDSVFSMPPGYRDAITLTLAEDVAGPNGREVPPIVSAKAQQARARIFANNVEVPRLQTQDAGMPGSGGRRSAWNYYIGADKT